MKRLAVALLILGVGLSVTVAPGPFLIDDGNYFVNVLALRSGRVTIANTEGLSPSRELMFFDPDPVNRAEGTPPVASTAPPLYAFLALPFSFGGWRGLVALNTCAYLITTLLVFLYARRFADEASTPWIAAVAFALGGYAIEYAQGVWPQAVSLALCTGGIMAAGRSIDGGRPAAAAAAGLLLGVAAGVRYQNAVLLATAGAAIALVGAERIRAAIAFGIAAAGPLAGSAALNHARFGSWNPISKGPYYLRVPPIADASGSIWDPLVMAWARVVDFAVRPPLVGPEFRWVSYNEATGAHLIGGMTVQKAFLQSAPWALVAILIAAAAALPAFHIPDRRRRQLLLLGSAMLALVVAISFGGVRRHEGPAYNQRYLLELLPLAAVAFAWALDGLALRGRDLLAGGLVGAASALWIAVALVPGDGRQLALLRFPLLLACVAATAWLAGRSRERVRPFVAVAAGSCLGWALTIHVAEDVRASHRLRSWNAAQAAAIGEAIGDRAALVAYGGNKVVALPLLFSRDIVVVDAQPDEGTDARMVIRDLLSRDRRVFVHQPGFTGGAMARVVAGWQIVPVRQPGTSLIELRATPPSQ